jgi:hypothetical protein
VLFALFRSRDTKMSVSRIDYLISDTFLYLEAGMGGGGIGAST